MHTDFHMHSTHSIDGHHSIDAICRQAVNMGLDAIAVTDHVEWISVSPRQFPDYERYFADIEAARTRYGRDGLTVLSGAELGNPHQYPAAADLLNAYNFDVVIGSIHWLDGRNIHLSSVFEGRDPYGVYADYFAEMTRMVRLADFHILAHFDRIFMPGVDAFGPVAIARLEGPVRKMLDATVQHGKLLEVNTKLLDSRPGWNETMRTVLGWYREAGGTYVSINSDAHRAQHIGQRQAVGLELAREWGLEPAGIDQLPTAITPAVASF
ncbi:MAG: PHP domain-containing protein [Caldilineaceae bacterium]|nr:PHP domain-containing protein [Caldilineaceae bacterium]